MYFLSVVLAIGRTANIKGLGLDKIGVHVVNDKVLVDENEQTSLAHIYALGDVATGKSILSVVKRGVGEIRVIL